MISLDNLTVSYGGWTLFDNISFLINPKDRIGLVGRNGAGKTTLLRIITGEQQPTSGSVTLNGDCTIGYLPQTMRVADTTTLAEETAKAFEEVLRLEAEIEHLTHEIAERTDYESDGYAQLLHRLNDAQDHYHILGGETREADIEKTLLGLGFKRGDFGRPTSEFSGGWRMRIELAKLLLRRPSIFLLDEPTNHLDIESIQWLEDYLKNYSGAVLLISHDRAFLDNVTNRTVELSLGKATDYKVSYSKYVVLRAERRAQQKMIRKAGAKAGVSIKPATSVEVLRDILPLVDLVLVMSVEPGFGGQSFIPASTGKIRALRAMARELGLQTIIEVDGGISSHNSREVYEAGADVLVAGNAVFGAEDPQAEIVRMLNA